jgi:ubiquinone/menaquinone biosynthesis C-methylase UbiE
MKDIESYYDKRSKNYYETFGTLYLRVYDTVTWRYLEPYVPTDSNALVLDAGGGTGRWAIRMAEKGCEVVLMDASAGMLRVADEKAKAHGFEDRVSVKIGDITKTGYADGPLTWFSVSMPFSCLKSQMSW